MTNIILSGCGGKMGRVISEIATTNDDINIVCGVDINAENISGTGYEVVCDINDYDKKADVVIDFSHPSAFDTLVSYCEKTKTPIVMCTTGLSKDQRERLQTLSKDVAVFYSANMSVGVNLVMKLVSEATKALCDGFDIEIIERHHNQKIDAPSGTALAIADVINESAGGKMNYEYDRHSRRAKRSKAEIGIHSLRGGSIVGDHEIVFAGRDEVIEISHHAASKEIFAVGALRAAQFLKGKPAGMYNMNDMLK